MSSQNSRFCYPGFYQRPKGPHLKEALCWVSALLPSFQHLLFPPGGFCSFHIFPFFSQSFLSSQPSSPSFCNRWSQDDLIGPQESGSLCFSASLFRLQGARRVPPGYLWKGSCSKEKWKVWEDTVIIADINLSPNNNKTWGKDDCTGTKPCRYSLPLQFCGLVTHRGGISATSRKILLTVYSKKKKKVIKCHIAK